MNQIDHFGEKELNLKKAFLRALKFWYLFPIFLVLASAGAIYLYKTTTPMYKISARLLISDNERRSTSISSGTPDGGGGLPGVILGGQNNIENQIVVLTSYKQVEKTLNHLNFGISYFKKGMFRTHDIYTDSPFEVIVDTTVFKLQNRMFYMEFVSKDEFLLTIEGNKEFKRSCRFFEKIIEPGIEFTIIPVTDKINGSEYIAGEYGFKVNSLRSLVLQYQAKIRLERVTQQSSIVEVSIVENNVNKGIDFLNTLVQMSVNYTLEKKNQVASNTINFIEKQLIGVMDSLSRAEKVLEDFRSRNEVMDVSMQGQMIIQQSRDLANQRADIIVRLDYYNYLIDYLETNRDVRDLKVPSVMGVDDASLTALITELSTLNSERSSLQFNSKEGHPQIVRIDNSIAALKNSIAENTRSIISTTNMSLRDLDQRLMKLTSQIQKLPRTEQMLLGIQRRFELSDGMYTYLMEQRSDALLAKAANVPDNEIIEEAMLKGMVAPDSTRSIIIVILIGIFLPCVIIFLIIFLNEKVQDKEDVELICEYPVIGQIPFQKKLSNGIQMADQPRSGMAESFRGLRTSLNFFAYEQPNRTYLLTSTLPTEGKTFCAVNLAISFAQMGKKTLLMGFDLRKPSLYKYFGKGVSNVGIGEFYIDSKHPLFIQQDSIDNLDLLFSGMLPPNPSELIAGPKTQDLFDKLKKQYDVIVIDSTPLALVSDTHLLAKYADVNLLVVKHNFTPKSVLKLCLNDSKVLNLKNLSLIINGMPIDRSSYIYSYGYGKGYYSN